MIRSSVIIFWVTTFMNLSFCYNLLDWKKPMHLFILTVRHVTTFSSPLINTHRVDPSQHPQWIVKPQFRPPTSCENQCDNAINQNLKLCKKGYAVATAMQLMTDTPSWLGNIGGEKTIMLRHKPTKSSLDDIIELKQQDIKAWTLYLNQIMSCHPQHQNLDLLYMVI